MQSIEYSAQTQNSSRRIRKQ